jgi:hypothetical protein
VFGDTVYKGKSNISMITLSVGAVLHKVPETTIFKNSVPSINPSNMGVTVRVVEVAFAGIVTVGGSKFTSIPLVAVPE